MSGFSVLSLCNSMKGQKADLLMQDDPFLRDLNLADQGFHSRKTDLLIAADYYWNTGNGTVRKSESEGPTA